MNLLNFYIPEWFWVAFNLLVLVLLLRKILWKRVFGVLQERQEMVAKTVQDAEEAESLRAEMEQLRARLDEELGAKTAREMQEARTRAGKEFDRIVSEADAKAAIIISAAKTKAIQERDALMVKMKGQVAETAVAATGLLLRANMDSDRNKKLLEDFLSEGDISA
jgi:F-type H+-transporting ATPase subunit b